MEQNRILETIEALKPEIVENLAHFVRIPSVQGEEQNAQLFYKKLLEDISFTPDIWEPSPEDASINPNYMGSRAHFQGSPNVVGVLKGSGGGKSILLNGHVDTVPPGDSNWDESPWSGGIREGRVYGRGASDMKAGLMANYMAIKAIAACGVKLKGDVILESVVDEETGGMGTLSAIKRGYKADGAIVSEPTDLRICPVQMGAMWFRITVKGKASHAGTAHLGVSAIEKSAVLIKAFQVFNAARGRDKKHALYAAMPASFGVNIGLIKGGLFPTIVPDKVILEGRMGISPDEEVPAARAALESAVSAAAEMDPWLAEHPPMVEWYGFCLNSGAIPLDHELVKNTAANYKAVKGSEPVIAGTPWGTDAGALNRFANTPALIFGPGPGGMAHQANEYIEISQLVDATKVIALTVLSWCGRGA
jgi:acetylornithine deacetylase